MDARWTKKHGKSNFGYKVSANAAKRYQLVRKIKVSTASEHDTTHFEDVLDPANTKRNILADKGYVDSEREARLGKQGWRMHIQRKGSKDKPIFDAQQRRNLRIAKTRARIEHVFAAMAQMDGKALRCAARPFPAIFKRSTRSWCRNHRLFEEPASCEYKSHLRVHAVQLR